MCFKSHTSYNMERELVPGYGVYAPFVDLEAKEQNCKDTCTGLMRHHIGLWYPSKGINEQIRTAVFSKTSV